MAELEQRLRVMQQRCERIAHDLVLAYTRLADIDRELKALIAENREALGEPVA